MHHISRWTAALTRLLIQTVLTMIVLASCLCVDSTITMANWIQRFSWIRYWTVCEVVLCMLTCFPLISLCDSHRQTLNNGNISQLLWPTKLNSNISTLRQHYFHIYSKRAILHTETTKLFISCQTRSWLQWWEWFRILWGRPWQLPIASPFQTQQMQRLAFQAPVWPLWIQGTGKGTIRMWPIQQTVDNYSYLVEKHAQHHLVSLLRQVGEEEDLVRRRIVHIAAASMTSSSSLVQATSCSCREAASSSSCCSTCLGFLGLLCLRGQLSWDIGEYKFVFEWLAIPVGRLGLSTKVPFIFAMMSESPRAKSRRIGLS